MGLDGSLCVLLLLLRRRLSSVDSTMKTASILVMTHISWLLGGMVGLVGGDRGSDTYLA